MNTQFSSIDRSSKSQVYELMFGSQKIPVYCHMGNFGCGDGGWTLAMKIDGSKVHITKLIISQVLWKFNFSFFNHRKRFTTSPISGATEMHKTLEEEKLVSIHKRPSYRPIGTHPSPRFASE